MPAEVELGGTTMGSTQMRPFGVILCTQNPEGHFQDSSGCWTAILTNIKALLVLRPWWTTIMASVCDPARA
eukprot:scaffold41995_cov18-Prasinocladus_malaysianus.AAC.2